jgi:hypothetical protein
MDLRTADIDCAQLSDGSTFITFQWLEALGLSPEGETGLAVWTNAVGPLAAAVLLTA